MGVMNLDSNIRYNLLAMAGCRSWNDVTSKYKELMQDVSGVLVLPYLFSAYHIGRDNKENTLQLQAKALLGTTISDLERRLPWYEVMFDIMDKGTFVNKGITGPHKFYLNDDLKEDLAQKVKEKANIKASDAHWIVRFLARSLGEVPGIQYSIIGPHHQGRSTDIALLSIYLYQPIRTFLTLEDSQIVADFHFNSLQYRLDQHTIH